MSNLRALLHHEVLLSTYDQGGAGVQTPLFDRFFTNPTNLDTDDASFLVRPATKTAAPLNRRHAQARQLTLQGKSKKAGAMFHVFNSFRMSPEVFQGLVEPESNAIQRIARREIADQMDHFGRMHLIQKELITAKLLVDGEVAMDSSGNILESAGADDETFDFGIDATHQGDANGLVGDSWDDPHIDIQSQLEDIKDQAREENAPAPELAICNSTMKRHFRANVQFQTFAAQHMEGQRVLYGEMVEGLFGMDWLFVDETYVDSSGTTRKYIPDERVILVPKANDWIQAVNGLELVPTKVDIQGTIDNLVSSLAEVYGKFAYAKCEHNPVGLDVYVGDNYGYLVREPNAIWQLDVIFT